jgi:hypothetical protein
MSQMINEYIIVVGKPEEKGTSESPTHGWEENIECIARK